MNVVGCLGDLLCVVWLGIPTSTRARDHAWAALDFEVSVLIALARRPFALSKSPRVTLVRPRYGA